MRLSKLKKYLSYNPSTGEFTSLASRQGVTKGAKVGWLNCYGLPMVQIDSKTYSLRKLAWLYVYGKYPHGYVYVKNGVKEDLSINNLMTKF